MLGNLKTILKGSEDQDYTELVMENDGIAHLPIVVDRVESFSCSDRIIKNVREGKVVFAKVGDFKNINVDEFKRTISKIKNVCTAINGDIVGVSGDWLIISPSSAKIERDA
ncbi:MAG: cell division protein SepF [Candidatus Aenigmarchaeota archaeon]|nr:cell division protein SepF [Candidatus Aenigmarchaeota archaeon]